ncbi:hypothetical protein AALA79_02625 [Lachnospiraceae bacterium 64-25]
MIRKFKMVCGLTPHQFQIQCRVFMDVAFEAFIRCDADKMVTELTVCIFGGNKVFERNGLS